MYIFLIFITIIWGIKAVCKTSTKCHRSLLKGAGKYAYNLQCISKERQQTLFWSVRGRSCW